MNKIQQLIQDKLAAQTNSLVEIQKLSDTIEVATGVNPHRFKEVLGTIEFADFSVYTREVQGALWYDVAADGPDVGIGRPKGKTLEIFYKELESFLKS